MDNAHSINDAIQVSDKRVLVDEISETRNRRKCRSCPVVIEPLMVLFTLIHFPLGYTIPEYIRSREWERLTGSTNYTTSKSKCLSGDNLTSHNDYYHRNMTLASSAASYFDLEMTLVASIPAIVAMMFIGPFSDKAGRKYAILPSLFGHVVALLACTLTAFMRLPIETILAGFFIFGCCGLCSSFYSGCYSYISDITPTEKRSFRLIVATTLLVLSSMISTVSTGFLVETFGFGWIFFSMLIISVLLIFYALLLVPETISIEGKIVFFTCSHIKNAFTVVLTDDTTKRRWKQLVLFSALFAERLASGSSSIDTLFSMGRPLCWGADLVGVFASVRLGVSLVGTGIFGVWTLKPYIKDEWLCILSAASSLVAHVFRFFVKTTAMMFGSTAFEFAAPLLSIAVRSMLTKLVRSDEIGAIMGGVAVFEITCTMLGHVITNPLYSVTEKAGYPSAVYMCLAGCYFICTAIMCVYAILTAKRKKTADSGK